jgi:hypothetical protein
MVTDSTAKLKEFLKSIDELRADLQYEYKRIGGLKLEAKPPISGVLGLVEEALKIDVMMIAKLQKDMAEYFTILHQELKNEMVQQLTTKEQEVKGQLEDALQNVENLRLEMKREEDRIASDIQTQMEEKFKEREQDLIKKMKEKRQEDLFKYQRNLKSQEEQMKNELVEAIENVDRLRKQIADSGKNFENELRDEVQRDTKERERNIIMDLEKRMKTEMGNLESKYKARIEILENELQRAQKKIKELREFRK